MLSGTDAAARTPWRRWSLAGHELEQEFTAIDANERLERGRHRERQEDPQDRRYK
jgi:hypothetical protein